MSDRQYNLNAPQTLLKPKPCSQVVRASGHLGGRCRVRFVRLGACAVHAPVALLAFAEAAVAHAVAPTPSDDEAGRGSKRGCRMSRALSICVAQPVSSPGLRPALSPAQPLACPALGLCPVLGCVQPVYMCSALSPVRHLAFVQFWVVCSPRTVFRPEPCPALACVPRLLLC